MIRPLRALFHRSLDRRAAHLARRLAPEIPAGARLLDVGSGTGHNARAWSRATGADCVEVDVVDFHVVGPGPVLFDGARLPFADASCDVCILAFVLNYAADPVMLLREANRVASRSVLLLQSTCEGPGSRSVLRLRSWFQSRLAFGACRRLGLIPPSRLPARPHRLDSRTALDRLCAEAGLVPRRVEPERGFAGISRDLMILERRGVAPSSPSLPALPSISVIIPARNEAAAIGATVASVLRARDAWHASGAAHAAVEVIVVDNDSTDGTAAVVARLAAAAADDVRVVTCLPRGAAAARNLGAQLAVGEVFVFLDADTQLPPGAIGRFAELAGAGGYEAGIARLGALDGGRLARWWWAFWNAVRRLPLARAKAMPACMFCTRAAFAEFGPFDVRVAIGEEWPILAGLYRARPRRLIYDRATVALSSSRRMELQRFGYVRTFARYVWAILTPRGRVAYPDHLRHPPADAAPAAAESAGRDPGVASR